MTIMSVMLISQTVTANSCKTQIAECEEVLEISMRVVRAQQTELNKQLQTLMRLDNENESLLVQQEKLVEQSRSWYKNPFIMGALGFAAGVVVIEVAK